MNLISYNSVSIILLLLEDCVELYASLPENLTDIIIIENLAGISVIGYIRISVVLYIIIACISDADGAVKIYEADCDSFEWIYQLPMS